MSFFPQPLTILRQDVREAASSRSMVPVIFPGAKP
jgi:hypothetical protein